MIIVIEGTDGSGKQTQSQLLFDCLKEKFKNVKMQSFPNYKNCGSVLVKKYLNGDFGDVGALSPFQASVFFSVDRLTTMQKYVKFLNDGGILILDRYVSSNILHQASKIENGVEREKFVVDLERFEYENLKLPKPNLTIFLDLKPEISKKLRETRMTLKSGTINDIHEKNFEYLKKCYKIGKDFAKKRDWEVIKCYKNDNILTIDEIHKKIKTIVDEFLKNFKEN